MSSPRSDDEQTTLSSEDRELLSRAGVGLTAPKPISVWIAQIIFALAALANLVVGLGGLAVNPFAAVVALVVAAFLVALIVAGQVRRMGARWLLGSVLALFCALALVQHCTRTLQD